MLSKNQMVKVRKALAKMFVDTCTITAHQKYTKDNGATGFRDVILYEDVPCHLSIESVVAAQSGEVAAKVVQSVKLFISPDLVIPSGSKITVKHDGVTGEYKNSGVPAVHAAHQEVVLELWDGWS